MSSSSSCANHSLSADVCCIDKTGQSLHVVPGPAPPAANGTSAPIGQPVIQQLMKGRSRMPQPLHMAATSETLADQTKKLQQTLVFSRFNDTGAVATKAVTNKSMRAAVVAAASGRPRGLGH